MFVEMVTLYECYLPVAQKFAIPVIGTLSLRARLMVDYEQGNPHPLVIPFLFRPHPVRMSFYQRIQNFFDEMQFEFIRQFKVIPKLQKFYQIHFPGYDLSKNKEISFLFTNQHSSIFPTATAPITAEIGGIHVKPSNPLPPVSLPGGIRYR